VSRSCRRVPGAYTQSYGWVKHLILDYVRTHTQHATFLDVYITFAMRPVTTHGYFDWEGLEVRVNLCVEEQAALCVQLQRRLGEFQSLLHSHICKLGGHPLQPVCGVTFNVL
jgi:hypothetical protein